MHNKVIWIGPKRSAEELNDAFVSQDVDLSEFDSADAALEAIAGVSVAAAIITADWGDATPTIEKLVLIRPEIQIVAATRLGVPMHLGLLLRAGATNVLDLEAKDTEEIGGQIRTALDRYGRTIQERELLLRLRDLNEEFLRTLVTSEKLKIEIEKKVAPRTHEPSDSQGFNTNSYRVLVIDDEPSMLQLFSLILEDEEYDLVTAADGESGLETFRAHNCPLVITDKNLPGISGLDVMREVKETAPDTEVMMITGFGSKESAIDALHLGASAFLEKPFDDVDVVLAKVREVVNKQKEKARKRQQLLMIKDRNREFLDNYRAIRADIEGWLSSKVHA
ncbi:response regulator [Myxococcota bacterium]